MIPGCLQDPQGRIGIHLCRVNPIELCVWQIFSLTSSHLRILCEVFSVFQLLGNLDVAGMIFLLLQHLPPSGFAISKRILE